MRKVNYKPIIVLVVIAFLGGAMTSCKSGHQVCPAYTDAVEVPVKNI